MHVVMTQTPRPSGTVQMSHSLLFQFILVEFFNVRKQVSPFKPLVSQSSDPVVMKAMLLEHLSALINGLTLLVGTSQGYIRRFSWNNEWGILNKLNHYVFLFTRHDFSIDDSLLSLQNDLHKMLLAALQCRDFLYVIRAQGADLPEAQYSTFVRNVNHIRIGLSKLADFTTNLIPTFRRDENLLFFLLRYQQDIEELHGKEFLPLLICDLFPDGIQEMETFLHARFSARAFPQLLPIISEKLSRLASHEKQNVC